MKKLLQMKIMLLLCALIVGSGTMWAEDPTSVTINFGTTTGYWAAHTNATTYPDSDSRTWTRTCSVSNMSGQGAYSQFGNASNTCESLVFTATAGSNMTVTAFSVTMAGASGGNSPTTGTIYLYKKSGETETQLATASVSGTTSVTCAISENQSFSKTDELKVSYVGTAKAIRISELKYSYTTSGGDQPTTYTVTYDANGATEGTVPVDDTEYDAQNNTVTVLGNTGDLAKTGCAFDGWNTQADGQGTNYTAGGTFNISANTTLYAKWTPYTITALSNNESYGTVSLSDNVITGSPNSGYRYANPAYTVSPENSATVVQDGNTFTVTPTANTTITINFEAIPTHTATFSVNGTTTTTDFQEGAAITFPANPADINGKSFVGWTTAAIEGTTDTAPELVTSATMGNADITYYAVFADVTPGTITNITDHLTTSTFGSPSSYGNWSDKKATDGSDAVYAGNSTTYDNTAIQIRSGSNSGIVTTVSGGKAKKVTVTWNSGTTTGRTLDIYGKNTAYSAASDLYGNATEQGTKIGSIVYGTSTELTISGDYEFIGLRSNNGAMYLEQIDINWETGTPDTYSGYCTTFPLAAPTFSPEAGSYTSVQSVTISAAEGATIYYTTNGTDPTTESTQYSGAITVDESMTIKAIAVKDSEISDVATAVYDIDLSPVITVASPIELDGNTPSKNITISYNNFTPGSDDFGVVYCDENGDELSGGYDWIEKITQWIDETPNTATMRFMFDPNTGSAPRTAYMKIYAMNGNDRVYSELITITQEVYVEPTKVSFYVNGGPIEYSYLEEGALIVFPEVSNIDGMTFLGWTSTEINGTTDTAPEFVDVTSAIMGTEDIDYYAVFAVNSGIGSYTLDYSKEENLSSSTDWGTYGKVLNYEAEDGSVWTIKAYKNAGMQINNGKDCSIKVPGCPGYISTIEITCSAAKAVGFSSNNYEGSGNITYVAEGTDATSQTLNLSNSIINTGYIVPKGGSTSITKIIVNYSIYSDYCTTIPTTGTLTLNAACHDNEGKIYGTFYTNRPYIMPATLRGSVVSVDDDGKLVVDEVYDGSNSEVVPANTALLISTADNFTGTHDYTITYATGGDDHSESNMLKGTLTADEETEGDGCLFYRLTMHNGETIGFWWGAAEGGKFKLGANKAYLAVPTSVVSARSGFAFDDEATGISQIENGKLKIENYYDLQGRKVSMPGKGLYIVNGKKVVIK